MDLTVAIRTYNAAPRLPQVLDLLLLQRADCAWEVLVVDNNSTDDTAAVMADIQQRWQKEVPLRYLQEPRQGAAFSRRRALREAKADWVAFLDDDNYPAADWVQQVWGCVQRHPQAGALSGKIVGEFELLPPPGFQQIATYLALIDRGDRPFSYNDRKDRVLPPGAGLVIRRSAWLQACQDAPFISGPMASSVGLKGEDLELLGRLQKAGWDILYCPELVIHHHIPAWRLERGYLLQLVRSVGLAQHRIRMERLHRWQRPVYFLGYVGVDVLRVLNYFVRHRGSLSTSTVAACQMEKLKSTLISPLYIWWLQLGRGRLK